MCVPIVASVQAITRNLITCFASLSLPSALSALFSSPLCYTRPRPRRLIGVGVSVRLLRASTAGQERSSLVSGSQGRSAVPGLLVHPSSLLV